MSRLTKKHRFLELYIVKENVPQHIAFDKLGKLEDIEDELGCPLDVVFRAIKEGIVVKPYEDEYGDITLWNSRKETELDTTVSKLDFEEPQLLFFDSWVFSCSSGCYRGCVRLKDYKKTWWLKGEKDEKAS